jgi:putative endonuclease
MVRERRYYVYIMASKSRVIYVGVTGFLMARVLRHKGGEGGAFTSKYRVHRLVYFHGFQNVGDAIARETEIKGWRREKKVALIRAANPTWEDLAVGWGGPALMKVSRTAGSSPGYRPVRNDKELSSRPKLPLPKKGETQWRDPLFPRRGAPSLTAFATP